MNTLDLSSFFQTKAQASDFASRIASLSEKLYETNFNLEKQLLNEFGLKKKDRFMTLLHENNISAESNTSLKDFFAKMQQHITSLPLLTLTIAFEPNDETMKTLAEWFLLNINKQVVFEIIVDRSLVAGAAISFNGKQIDLSIHDKFSKAVQNISAKPVQVEKTAQTVIEHTGGSV
jgi:F0F1-type ATP synthase delta subunit